MPRRDEREFIFIHDGMPDHPKVEGLSDKAFRLLVSSWCWCARQRTDGRIIASSWKKRSTPAARRELLDAGLVHDDGNGGVIMHDYLDHQRSAADIAAQKAEKSAAGSVGNHVRHHTGPGRKPNPDCPHCQADRSQTPRRPVAGATARAIAEPSQTVAEVEEEKELTQLTAASPDPYSDHEQQQLDDLRHELNRQGLAVSWASLDPKFTTELTAAIATHGIATLVTAAAARADPAKPARHVAAWRDIWNNLAPPQTPSTPAEAFARLQARYQGGTP